MFQGSLVRTNIILGKPQKKVLFFFLFLVAWPLRGEGVTAGPLKKELFAASLLHFLYCSRKKLFPLNSLNSIKKRIRLPKGWILGALIILTFHCTMYINIFLWSWLSLCPSLNNHPFRYQFLFYPNPFIMFILSCSNFS